MAQAATKTTETKEPETVTPARSVEIDPRNVQIDSAGQCWRTVLVRCPADMTQDDLRAPSIWLRCQAARQSALIKYDSLRILSHDESWLASAIVNFADSTSAHLTILKVTGFREKDAALFSDGTYRVVWLGSGGYGIERVADSLVMGNQSWPHEAGAIAGIRQLHPVETGGQNVVGQ